MATKEEGEAPLSPRTEAKINHIRQAVRTGKAQLREDSQGRIQTVYANERAIPLSHVKKSEAHAIQVGKDADDTRLRVDAWLKMIEAIRQTRAPSGVVIDETKAGISDSGQYTEGQQFTCLGEVLGKGNYAGTVIVIKDSETGIKHAMKTVMISKFCSNEVRAWLKLGDLDHFPSLYLLRLDGNKVVFHMEKVEHGVTLTDFIQRHMIKLHDKAPELVRPFSLCMFHSLLSAVGEMHDKNWAHWDLHDGNVMISKDTMELTILDFGKARPLWDGFNFNYDALKKDILYAIHLFCRMYIRRNEDISSLETKITTEKLDTMLPDPEKFSQAQREELLKLIKTTYEVTVNPQLEGYGSTSTAMRSIEDSLSPDEKRDVMMRAAKILFPEFYETVKDIALREGGEVEVTTGDSVPEDAAEEIPDDFQGLSIKSEEDV